MTAFAEALARARHLMESPARVLLGIAGAPGSGKSTLATTLADALGPDATSIVANVPMDGFHLANCELARLGRAGRKGAPDTFDIAGFVALLRRLREEPSATIYAPLFRREIEEPIAGAIPVPPSVRLIIIEGNYLLCDGPWAPVRTLLDSCWFVDTPEDTRLAWLTARHMRFGRTAAEARDWATHVDGPNAALVRETASRADWRIVNAVDAIPRSLSPEKRRDPVAPQ
ncbi:nucleoside/nucleotide kinase family protein [Acidomonas methanolica]|uniref:Panthothenate kinase n=1 Tax=Acidomonas methanolica NBRC 104435 TaxID=1231351 RepID=A0A023D4Q7_ACIMT|nr:nucleoside/nucleotide kinase family protein [Acidomonas methanolica]TCS31529.1 pantothenate kinase [Acidomonas methanolica]GAJ28740.1 panthothenate kinase [Acidomonas methanolica NBRC 104435]GBQ47652.1 panthothenate kinase [Acidomonas methanolica]GEK97948.1 nucleoside/nucleotide kinase family protein [Acidomonas methanolica NBRC 104435]